MQRVAIPVLLVELGVVRRGVAELSGEMSEKRSSNRLTRPMEIVRSSPNV
jgi:hypothetical protein